MSEENVVKTAAPIIEPIGEMEETLPADALTQIDEFNKVVEASAPVAEQLLKTQGWEILKQLYLVSAQHLRATQGFILPVMGNLPLIESKLSDFEGFQKNISTLIEDLGSMTDAVRCLGERHLERTGEPTPEDHLLIAELSLGYNNVQTHLETAVEPLISSLIDVLQKAGITDLTVNKEQA
jgi:hypothetical protein